MHAYPCPITNCFKEETENHANHVVPSAVHDSLCDLHEQDHAKDGGVQGVAGEGWDVVDGAEVLEEDLACRVEVVDVAVELDQRAIAVNGKVNYDHFED